MSSQSKQGVLGALIELPVKEQKDNFDTLSRAFASGNVGLVEVTLKSTGEKLAAVCAIVKDNGTFVVTPFALMMNGNPYELLEPPKQ